MFDIFIKAIFFVSIGLALIGVTTWYTTSLYEEFTGQGSLVILPLTVANDGDSSQGRGEALARMLRAHLQQVERNIAISQKALVDGGPGKSGLGTMSSGPNAPRTSIVHRIFAPAVSLQTRILEPSEIKLDVGGVDVGGLIPRIQRLLVTRRSLQLTYYESPTSVVVSGGLEALRLGGEALRVEVPIESGKPIDLDKVALAVATEISRKRLASDPSNRVEALNTEEFGDLVYALDRAAELNRRVALGRPARQEFSDLLDRIEPIAGEVHDWYQLQLMAASIAESADEPDRAVALFERAREAMQAQLEIKGMSLVTRSDLQQAMKDLDEKLKTLKPSVVAVSAAAERNAQEQLVEEVRRATEGFNKLFHEEMAPPPLRMLPAHEANAYWDGKSIAAPPEVAQLPEIVWHEVSWQYIAKFLPVLDQPGNQARSVARSYSDVLPLLIRPTGQADPSDPQFWEMYAGGVAWIKAATEGRNFVLGADRRPLFSFANPGQAYRDDPILGSDRQIANYNDLKPETEEHVAAGIGNKAFYEAAQRVGVERAGKIWLDALACVGPKKPVNFRNWAACLLDNSGPDRGKIDQALGLVGLGTSAETRPRTKRRPSKTNHPRKVA